jgi:oligoribonuclease NrnB/cAMP/cGMP phosphodiesterase (DHH superfamily)
MPKIYVLHHDDNDGYASALSLYQIYQDNATYIPVQYGQKFPDIVLDKETIIYIVDFSYNRDILEDVHSKVRSLLVLDHHESAEKQLEGLPYAIFDMKVAGATLCWNYFHGHLKEEMPYVLKLVDDYDLWKFEFNDTRRFHYGMDTLGYSKDLSKWNDILHSKSILDEIILTGGCVEEYVNNHIASFKSKRKFKVTLDNQGRRVAVYNTTTLINELAESLYKDEDLNIDYSMSYFVTKEGTIVFSLRSDKDNVNAPRVNDIAEEMSAKFGIGSGGGHPNAAGCNTSFSKGVCHLAGMYDLLDE